MSGDGGDRTEPATAKKRSDAVKEGDSLRSRDLGAALALGAGLGWSMLAGPRVLAMLEQMIGDGLTIDRSTLDRFEPGRAIFDHVFAIAIPFATLALITIIVAIAAGFALGGGRWSGAAIAFKASRLDPAKGLTRMFGADAVIGLSQALIKVTAITGVTGWLLYDQWRAVFGAPLLLAKRVAIVLVVIVTLAAIADVLVQWRRREGRLRMSMQEVRDEHKSSEGSPERKRHQRERQYAIAARSARSAMAEATVVLSNPLHFAVALRYRPGIDGVPVIVARGVDAAAAAIRDLADENGVPQITSVMLARALYFTGRIGQPVASELYLAVATVLAFVLDLDAAVAAGRQAPAVTVPDQLRFGPDGRRVV